MFLNWLTPDRTHYLAVADSISKLLGIEEQPAGNNDERYHATRIAEKRGQFRDTSTTKRYRLDVNLQKICNTLGLNDDERQILRYICISRYFHEFELLTRFTAPISFQMAAALVAQCIDLPVKTVCSLLNQNSKLIRSGLVCEKYDDFGIVKFSLSDLQLALDLIQEDFELSQLENSVGKRGSKPHLDLGHFSHLRSTFDLLIPYLKKSFAPGQSGVNILLHGRRGNGKSEFAKLLGQALGCGTFEPLLSNENDEPLSGERKLAKIQTILPLGRKEHTLLVCKLADEIHEESNHVSSPSFARQLKRLLKENQFPILWLSQSTLHMDEETIRSFDFIVEVTLPRRTQRYHMIQDAVGKIVSNPVITHLSTFNSLTPEIISDAAVILHQIHQALSPNACDRVFQSLIAQAYSASGLGAPIPAPINTHATYEPKFSNASIDLNSLVECLQLHPRGKFLIEGPTSSGKTALGVWLADSLDIPVHTHRAVDLFSNFLGQPGGAMIKAFEKTIRYGGVLMIEEIDALLTKSFTGSLGRKGSEIQEMLAQMENFRGLLIATTNRIDALDVESRRHFDLFISLGYLKPKQIRKLFRITTTALKLKPYRIPRSVNSIRNVTIKDFIQLERQHQYSPFRDGEALTEALISHCSAKE